MRDVAPSPPPSGTAPAAAEESEAAWRREHAGSGVTSGLILAFVERHGGRAAVDALLEHAGLTDREAELRRESCWFSYDTKLRLWQAAEAVTGDPTVATRVGASAFDARVGIALKRGLRALGSPDFVYRNVVRANTKFNWSHTFDVLEREPGRMRLAFRDICGVGYHRYDCQYTTGLFRAVPLLFGLPAADVLHDRCGARDSACCEFDIRWEVTHRGARGLMIFAGLAAAGLAAAGVFVDPLLVGFGVGGAGLTAGLAGARTAVSARRRVAALEVHVREQNLAADAQLESLAALSSELRLDRALQQITASAGTTIGTSRFALLVDDGERMRVDECSEVPAAFVDTLESWVSDHEADLRSGPVVVDNVDLAPELRTLAQDPVLPIGSACAAPLMFRDRLLGALVALCPGAGVFLPNDVRSLEVYASHAAIALWNARLVERLERDAAEDPLTGIANRRVLVQACATELDRAGREDTPVCLVMIDVDHFKRINDTYGHPFGDRVLVDVARLLRSVIRGHDTVARVGGEEFALLLPGASLDDAHEVAERARSLVAEAELPHGRLTCSAGVAVGGAGETVEGLLAAADRALYEAKRRGRDRTVLAPVPARAVGSV